MSSSLWPCEDEAQSYMEKHKIVELLDNLTAQVVCHRPGTVHSVFLWQSAHIFLCRFSNFSVTVTILLYCIVKGMLITATLTLSIGLLP